MQNNHCRFWALAFFAVTIALLAGACSSGSPSSGSTQGTISGSVKAVSLSSGILASTVLPGVTITVMYGATSLATDTSDSSGNYSLTLEAGSGYTITYSMDGYATSTYYNVTVSAGRTLSIEPILSIPNTYASGTGSISGILKDALSGLVLSGATLTLYSGMNVSSGSPLGSTITDSGGAYSFGSLDAGQDTVVVRLEGYTTTSFTVVVLGESAVVPNQNFSVTPAVGSGEIRIVLIWGSTPEDLDSHLKTPSGDHIFYGSEGSDTSAPYAMLDTDDTSSYGPETITIYSESSGTYTYYVNDYSNMGDSSSTALANSGATVKVYSSSGILATYYVPSGSGTTWKVFTLNGSNLTQINTIFSATDDDAVITGALVPSGNATREDQALFRNLPGEKLR